MIEYFQLFRRKGLKSLTFFVTGKCNARCKMCFYWKNNNFKKELSLEEIKKISKNLPNFFWLWISGGEPFLRGDLPEICEAFYLNNKISNIQIPTNGLLPEVIRKKTEEILKKCKGTNVTIIFSIDDIEEKHDFIRGVSGTFDKVFTSIEMLKELQKKYKNLNIQATITLSSFNQEDILNIYKELRKKLTAVNVNLVRGNTRDKIAKDVNINNYIKIHNYLLRDYKKYSIYPFPISAFVYAKDAVMRELIIKTFRDKKRYVSCKALSNSLVLDEQGNVFPCEMLPDKLGDLREEKYEKILEKNKVLRKSIEKECFCTHECSLTSSIIYSPRYFPKFAFYLMQYFFKANR
jgi:Fe-coproporphyrin III synthase